MTKAQQEVVQVHEGAEITPSVFNKNLIKSCLPGYRLVD